MIELLNEWDEKGLLVKYYKKGIIASKLYHQREVYLKYDSYIKAGKSVIDAVFLTCVEFKVSERTVYRSIKIMKS